VRQVVKEMGFKWKRCRSKRRMLMGRQDILKLEVCSPTENKERKGSVEGTLFSG
jgi:hypothetical protein